MAAGGSSHWKSLLLPPLLALLLYLLTTYLLLPTYRRLLTHTTYHAIPSSPSSRAFAHSLSSRLHSMLGLQRRDSDASGAESLLGDEELEEGFGDVPTNAIVRQDTIGRMVRDAEGGRGSEMRLSQELERGFRDSSDEEEEDERGRGRGRR